MRGQKKKESNRRVNKKPGVKYWAFLFLWCTIVWYRYRVDKDIALGDLNAQSIHTLINRFTNDHKKSTYLRLQNEVCFFCILHSSWITANDAVNALLITFFIVKETRKVVNDEVLNCFTALALCESKENSTLNLTQ